MSVKIEDLTVENTIFAYAMHAVSLNAVVSADGVTANDQGQKIIPAGTVLGGSNDFRKDENAVLTKSNNSNAQCILEHDLDVTDGSGNASVVVAGYVNTNKLPETVSDDAKKQLSHIEFVAR